MHPTPVAQPRAALPAPSGARRSKVARRTAPAIAAAVFATILAVAPASAATYTVRMPGLDFSPQTLTIGRGDAVKWRNNGSFGHDVYATKPNGLFASPGGEGGMSPDETYTYTFRHAGTFTYVCRAHEGAGMRGTVRVPLGAKKVDNGDRIRLILASGSVPSGYHHDVWVDRPGSTGWQHLADTTATTYTFTPSRGGTYKFKARLQSGSNASRFSPVKSLSF